MSENNYEQLRELLDTHPVGCPYALLNSIQIFENPYRKGIHDETIKKLTPLWKEYRATSLPSLGGETTSILRVIPIEK